MAFICRKGDSLTTGHGGTLISTLDTPTQSTVFAEGDLVARKDDQTVVHSTDTFPHQAPITGSASTVFMEGKEVARIGDAVDAGVLTTGATTVNVE